MMASAGFVQMNGVGCSFQLAMYFSRCSRSAFLLGKFVSDSDCFERMPKNPSTWLSHEALVGV